MWNSSGRIIIIVVLVLLLSFALEMYPLGLTAVFGQNSHPSNQSPSSSSSVLSENQKNNFKPFDYSISPSTGINSGGTGIGSSSNYSSSSSNNNNSSKLVILNFDDGFQNQYTYAKPILDKYAFKASFFVVCNYAGKPDRMSWQEITTLHDEGYDVESHSMNHNHMNLMTPDELNYEIGQSKQCLADHGINATIFAYPFDIGWDDPTIVNIVSKYYDLARTGNDPLTFLNCDGYKNHPQIDCRTYTDNGELTFANRYSVRSWSHDIVEIKDGFNDDETYNKFIEEVNSQNSYNNAGAGDKINAIPLITYHNVDYLTGTYHTDVDLFAKEMKYLHDNGFRVLTMTNLRYDDNTNSLYLVNAPRPAPLSL
jgi:peptidoglycan/xylan/chitin deacetylase (PgdA/CDA1 family)